MTNLFPTIERTITEDPHGWTSVQKAQIMASMVLALRPKVSVEIGVYSGKGLVSLALAHQAIGCGLAIGIDPYCAQASVQGQINPEDRDWWAKTDYAMIRGICLNKIERLKLNSFAALIERPSDTVPPPAEIGVLRVDGNHGEQGYRDVIRFSKNVPHGGFLILDDVDWAGGNIKRAAEYLRGFGWRELYKLDDGLVFQRQ